MARKTSKEMVECFEQLCNREQYEVVKKNKTRTDCVFELSLPLEGNLGSFQEFLIWKDDCVDILGSFEFDAGNRKEEVGEFLMRLNMYDEFGSWCLDYDEGDIGYQGQNGYVEFDDEGDFKALIDFVVILFNRVAPYLLKVIQGSLSPKEAFDELMENGGAF